jgi:hypothetical protein
MIDSSSRIASDDRVPSKVLAAKDRNSLLLDTRCGVRALHPLLNVTCGDVLAMGQVCLSHALKI